MEPRQLDIFADSRDVMLRNDLAAAIVAGDNRAARAAAAALQDEFPDDALLAPATRLIEHLAGEQASLGDACNAEGIIAERRFIEQQIEPAGRQVLGGVAAQWLATRWIHLARRAQAMPWRADQADAHAASLFIAAAAWAEAAEAEAGIASWRRIPQPLLWMTQARWRFAGGDAAWPLLAEALWLAPADAAALIPRLADACLTRLAQRFEDAFDPAGDGWAWLPAWALVEQPLLASVLAAAEPKPACPAADGFVLVAALLRMERQGRHHDIVERRKRLRGLSTPLFTAYMATR